MLRRARSIALDRGRHFARLAIADAHATVAVANHGQRGETELPATLDGLGDAVDRYQLFQQAIAAVAIVCSCYLRHIGRL
jgi:hypothetical protein